MANSDFNQIDISVQQGEEFAWKHYGLKAQAKKLLGEVDFNFYLKTTNQQEFTLKVSRPDADSAEIEFQNSLLNHLALSNFPIRIPAVVPTSGGHDYILIENNRYLRLHKWVPGRMLDDVNPHNPGLLKSWGMACGFLSKHLHKFDHPIAHRFYKWNPSEVLVSRKNRPYLLSKKEIEIADYFWDLFENKAQQLLAPLRKSVNYNDAHSHNLLADYNFINPTICGIIDFGDALYTETINELAIACAYACMDKPDPIAAACHMVSGYHKIFPIKEEELAVLFPLIGARLMLTVTNAAWNFHNEPDNKYLQISVQPAWTLLEKLHKISPTFAHFRFRETCGFRASTKEKSWGDFVISRDCVPSKIVDIQETNSCSLDLSVGSLELGNNSAFGDIYSFQQTIFNLLDDKKADIGIGGYAEIRPFYTTDAYESTGNNGAQWRTTHLGTDIWVKGETPVYAPFDGFVHSYQDNSGERNYGPTIILEHHLCNHLTIYSLFGHLNRTSLKNLYKGKQIKRGEQFATIGLPPKNGNWPPHLHFQIILDLMDYEGDFPGVAYVHEAGTWLSNSPDPGLLFPEFASQNQSIGQDKILSLRKEKLGKSLSISYSAPLHMVRGYMQYLYDISGRRYLDTVNNVPHVGHQHPRVVGAAQKQLAVLNTNTRYLHCNIVEFADELLETFPLELSVVHFVNSGSEANELALRMVESFTGSKEMIAVEFGYHGNTNGCINISSYKFDGKGGKGAPPTTHIVPIPDPYRGIYKNEVDAGSKYAIYVQQAVNQIQSGGKKIGGFICESIISCGGQIVPPKNYMKEAFLHVRSAGGLCIADEVQVGFGRVGSHFWGFELHDVIPDIVTVGKPIGNGHPLAAVITSHKVAEAFANGMEYFNTFGGNPVSCAIGREVLHIIQEEKLQENALKTGNYLLRELAKLKIKFPIIGDIRGHGLFLGIELVTNQVSLVPAAEQASYLANRMRERGILMSTDGPYHNVLKIKPPLCFNQDNADFLIQNLATVLSEDFLQIK